MLSPFPRLLLGYASVLGRSFNPLVWRQLLVDDGIEIDDGVTDELEQFVAVRPRWRRARFRQAVVRDVAYRGLPYRRRQVLHLRAGQVMERGGRRRRRLGGRPPLGALLRGWRPRAGLAIRAPRRVPRLRRPTPTATPPRSTAGPWRRAGASAAIAPEEHLTTWTALGDVLEQAGLPDGRPGGLPPGDRAGRRATTWSGRASCSSGPGRGSAPGRSWRRCGSCAPRSEPLADGHQRRGRAGPRGRGDDAGHRPRGPGAAPPGARGRPARRGRGRARSESCGSWPRPTTSSTGPMSSSVSWTRRSTSRGSWRSTRSLGEPHRAAAALGNQGAVLYWLGRWDEALDCYQRAHDAYVRDRATSSTPPCSRRNVAELLINRGELAAGACRRSSRRTDPSGGRLHRRRPVRRDPARAAAPRRGRSAWCDSMCSRRSSDEVEVAWPSTARLCEAAVHLAACRVEEGRRQEALADPRRGRGGGRFGRGGLRRIVAPGARRRRWRSWATWRVRPSERARRAVDRRPADGPPVRARSAVGSR